MSHRKSKEFWEHDFHHPRPVYPLFFDFCYTSIEAGTERAFAEWSLPLGRVRTRRVGGYYYNRLEPLGGDPPPVMAKLPFLGHLWRIHPVLGPRIRGCERWLQSGGMQANLDIWERVRPEAERRLAPLRAAALGALTDHELIAQLDGCYDYVSWGWAPHLQIHFVCMYFKGLFARVCHELLGLTETEAYELVQRTDPVLFDASGRLVAMARRAEQDAAVAAALELPADQALTRLKGTWFERDLNAYLDAWGDGPVDSWEFTDPTWREIPELVVGLVKAQMGSDYDPAAEDAAFQKYRKERIARLRASLSDVDRATFDRHLAWGEKAYPLNDVHNYLLGDVAMGLCRRATLEAGRRLAKAGSIPAAADVFHLTRAELTATLQRRSDLRGLIAQRQAERAKACATIPPKYLGTRPPAPDLSVMPPAVREAMSIILDQIAQMLGMAPPAAQHGQVSGLAGAPGVVEGIVRVVHGHADFGKVQPGDILVCPMTTPGWTPLFPLVAGLITDIGGPLCHAAIIAREYGKPAVVGAQLATRILQDGQRVRVDGDTGRVEISAQAALSEVS